jgi:single-strand DNA-binding protein
MWGKQAEGALPGYLKKGQQVAVTGELSTREYEGKTYLELRVNSIDLVGSKGSDTPQVTPPSQPVKRETAPVAAPVAAPVGVDIDSEIPF